VKPRDEGKARDILAATLKEVASVGLAGLSMEAVARRAEVATGTVYIYFKNKESLINALYGATKSELAGLVVDVEGLPVRVAFSRTCIALLEYVAENGDKIVFMSQVANSPLLSEKTKKEGAVGLDSLSALLERGKRELLLKDLETPFMFAFLQAALRGLAQAAPSESRAERARRFELIASLCWDALKA